MTKVIINADDFGYTEAINYGIIDCYTQGVLTSATLMANMPGFEHAVNLAKHHPGLGVGVHLVLTCESPVGEGYSYITAKTGQFHNQKQYQEDAMLFNEYGMIEVYQEWECQIEKVLRSGIKPTHLDSHHHMHITSPQLFDIAQMLALKYQLPLRVFDHQVTQQVKHVAYFERDFDHVGKKSVDLLHKNQYYQSLYQKIKQYDSVEIMTHPGYLNRYIMQRSTWLNERVGQVEELIDSQFVRLLREDQDVQCATYGSI